MGWPDDEKIGITDLSGINNAFQRCYPLTVLFNSAYFTVCCGSHSHIICKFEYY